VDGLHVLYVENAKERHLLEREEALLHHKCPNPREVLPFDLLHVFRRCGGTSKICEPVRSLTATVRTETRKRAREANAEKRQRDVETYGGGFELKRRLLLAHVAPLAEHGIEMKVSRDATLSDAIFRNKAIVDTCTHGTDAWLQWQHKTTGEEFGHNGWRGWAFNDTRGYGGMLVVCECEEDNRIWALDGAVLDKGSRDLTITRSKKTNLPLPDPCCHTLPIDFEGLVTRRRRRTRYARTGHPGASW
jgi:hypothetical protein